MNALRKSNFFYLRLALTNLRNNRSSYIPYMLSSTAIIGLYFVLHAISELCKGGDFKGAAIVGELLRMSAWIAGFLSVLMIFYTNSFLMKRRSRELGLYSILGMEKRHVAHVLFDETACTGIASLFCGILGGSLFGRLLFLILLNLLKMPVSMSFYIPTRSVLVTAALFLFCFALVEGYNILQIRLQNPINLLMGARHGEREPKAKWFVALLGGVSLALGYGLALWVQSPSDAVSVFFFSVLLVIAGTYLLFTAGSITLLKAMRANRRFYYQPRHMIAVSGMIYRMKQNAVGLSNICILSTCVLVTLSSTLSLYIGEESSLRNRYPRDVQITCQAGTGDESEALAARVRDIAGNLAQECALDLTNASGYRYASMVARRGGNVFTVMGGKTAGVSDTLVDLTILVLEEYNRETGETQVLGENEVLLCSTDQPIAEDTVLFGRQAYRIAARKEKPSFVESYEIYPGQIVVARDAQAAERIGQELYGGRQATQNRLKYQYQFDLSGDREEALEFCDALEGALDEALIPQRVENIYAARDDFYMMYGSLLFVGLFFVAMFLIAAVLIIYYKQISEGFEDRGRYQIMQKVGMSRGEVKRSIQGQVLTVFFLPLTAAIVHVAVAFPVLCKLLVLFNLTDTILFLGCTALTILAFAAFYFAVFRITAGVYYRIVENETNAVS